MIKRAQWLWAGRKRGLILTQVPSHQIGIVEILHAQSNNVYEFLYDLHELHCSGIDLDKIKKMRRHLIQHCCHDFTNAEVIVHTGRLEQLEYKIKMEKAGKKVGYKYKLEINFRYIFKYRSCKESTINN